MFPRHWPIRLLSPNDAQHSLAGTTAHDEDELDRLVEFVEDLTNAPVERGDQVMIHREVGAHRGGRSRPGRHHDLGH